MEGKNRKCWSLVTPQCRAEFQGVGGFCVQGASGQLHSLEAKRKQQWEAVFVQGLCFNLGLFSLLWQPVSTSCSCSAQLCQLWWPWCPGQGVCATAARGSAGNGINVVETRKNGAGVNSCKRELVRFSRGAGGLGG